MQRWSRKSGLFTLRCSPRERREKLCTIAIRKCLQKVLSGTRELRLVSREARCDIENRLGLFLTYQ